MVSTDGDMASGGVGTDPSGGDGHVTFNAETDDVQSSLDKAESLTLALFADPEGHVVGLVKPGAPPQA